MTNKSNSENQRLAIDDIINKIKEKSSDGDYIYRGERQPHCKVSSALYREYFDHEESNVDMEDFDLTIAQKELLKIAKRHIGELPKDIEIEKSSSNIFESLGKTIRKQRTSIIETAEIEILTELQHYGSKTNLIDFTTDYLIAIYFACYDHPKEKGRVILLQKTKKIEKMIIRPHNPRHRVIAQKSVFLHPPKGFVSVDGDDIVTIPASFKPLFLEYLQKYHDISAESIYNDIHGFIKNETVYQNSLKEFYIGLEFHNKGDKAENPTVRHKVYRQAISHYNSSIKLDSRYGAVFFNRAECRLHLGEWDKAKEDLITASDKGVNIVTAFHYNYKSVADFEKKIGLEVPSEIAKMLGN